MLTIDQLKEKSVTELKAIAFDLIQERELVNNSLNLIYSLINEKQSVPEQSIGDNSSEEILK